MSAVEINPNIKVYKSTTVSKTDGQPGLYDVTLSNGETMKIGAIVMASGWKPYDANKLDYLGYGKMKNVVTNFELEEIAKKNSGKLLRPSDGKACVKVAFIQCAGSARPEPSSLLLVHVLRNVPQAGPVRAPECGCPCHDLLQGHPDAGQDRALL